MIVLLRVLLALVGLVGSPTTTGDAATYAYDAPQLARVDACASALSEAGQGTLSVPLQWSASRSVEALGPVVATNTVDDVLGAVCSFSGETRVLMADGTTKPISKIEVGDEVLAYDPETGDRGPRKVTDLWVHQDDLVDLEIGGAIVATTEDHPFWNETDRQWERADALDPGDLVLTAHEVIKPIEGVKTGQVAPWFGEVGGGIPHELPNSVQWLVDNGYLKEAG